MNVFDLFVSYDRHEGFLFSHLITELFMHLYDIDLDRFDELMTESIHTELGKRFRYDLAKTEKKLINILDRINDVRGFCKEGWLIEMEIDHDRFPITIHD